MYRRMLAFLFEYRNGIRGQSKGILRLFGEESAPEVMLEFSESGLCHKKWTFFCFDGKNRLRDATYVFEAHGKHVKNELGSGRFHLCAEAGYGNGVVLLPEGFALPEAEGAKEIPYYLCARFDGAEVSEGELCEGLLGRKQYDGEAVLDSVKRLVEEFARAAGETECKEPEKKPLSKVEELLFTRPTYRPCEDASVVHSVRILPEEVRLLPEPGERFAENSFLLHGFFHYRHLLLGRRRKKEQDDYVLLVPGIYQKKNAYLAELFGFAEFLPAKPPKEGTASGGGPFGYWCAKI